MEPLASKKASSLRWGILRHAILRRPFPDSEDQSEMGMRSISRKTTHGFGLIPCHLMDDYLEKGLVSSSETDKSDGSRDICVCYTLPIDTALKLHVFQRVENDADLNDFELCNRYNIDNTGLVCHWPSEDVLTYYCLSHANMFRSKKVIELGSGYGLAGLAIAAVSEALEVVISDGNPQVVNYIQRNIDANCSTFGGTKVESMMLHWNEEKIPCISNTFDVIVASDCTFFKEFHKGLATTVKFLLKKDGPCEAIFFSPKRGDSLDKFLVEIKECGLHFSRTEIYDAEVWRRHLGFVKGDSLWPNYEKGHCYPLLVRITP